METNEEDVPLLGGEAEWPPAPIPQPGGNAAEDEGDGGGDDGLSFLPQSDVAVSSECDPWMQDCPEGEKCVAYASSGGDLDANKCVPITGTGAPGDPCMSAGPVEATDDCNTVSMCWDVQMSMGTCAAFCMGTADNAMCPPGYACVVDFFGSVTLCLPDDASTSGDTSSGDTSSGDTSSGDTSSGDTSSGDTSSGDTGLPAPSDPPDASMGECPDAGEPIVLYMSNDDSNSQASPILARRRIHEGHVLWPSEVRIHEFLNYYTIAYDPPVDEALDVGLQMRRTDPDTDEFTLLLFAQGRALAAADRPAMNLVFAVDTSGSMSGEPLELVKDSLTAIAGALRAGDVISIVQWNTDQSVLLSGHVASGADDPTLIATIEGLETSGGTDLHAGLTSGYALAAQHYIAGGLNRVILLSDGGANAGVTDLDLIAGAAAEQNEQVIYLMGVGVGAATSYNDALMDAVTDAGKGAYVFVDSPAEAEHMFGERFVSLASVAARDVRMRLTMPWYFGIKAFHGEEYSADPAEVEPQHLAPDDAMSFHQIIGTCASGLVQAEDVIEAHVDYLDPATLEPKTDTLSIPIGTLVEQDATQLRKADVVVSFAKALIVIGDRYYAGETLEAVTIAVDMKAWLDEAALALGDPEVEELAALMGEYVGVLM